VTLNEVGYLKDHDYIFDPTNYINELGLANSSAHVLPAGTVILSRDATIGRAGILGRPMATSQHFVNWICCDDLVPKYLLAVFKGPMQQEFGRLTMGATLRTIGMPDVNGFQIPLPPHLEQEAIVQYVEHQTGRLDSLVVKVKEQTNTLREHHTTLITAAVTGKIDVREDVS
jgi:type I restriction enzyme S subunit